MVVALFNNKNMFLSLQLTAILCLGVAFAELSRFDQPIKADGSLSFLVVGDWGRKGTHNQSEVSLQVIFYSLSLSLILVTYKAFH